MKTRIFLTVLVGLSLAGVVSAKGDAKKGKAKAGLCAACHGVDGKGVAGNDLWPKLAGQNQGYILKQLKAFKAGTRKDPLMSPMATPLSEDDMKNLAAYYSAVK